MMRLLAKLCSSQKTWDGPTIPTNSTKPFSANRHSGRNNDVRTSLRAPLFFSRPLFARRLRCKVLWQCQPTHFGPQFAFACPSDDVVSLPDGPPRWGSGVSYDKQRSPHQRALLPLPTPLWPTLTKGRAHPANHYQWVRSSRHNKVHARAMPLT